MRKLNLVGEATECKKCGSNLEENGACTDETCPYSDWTQNVPIDIFEEVGLSIVDIFDNCKDRGINARHYRLDDMDMFACVLCQNAHDIEDSIEAGHLGLICPDCNVANTILLRFGPDIAIEYK